MKRAIFLWKEPYIHMCLDLSAQEPYKYEKSRVIHMERAVLYIRNVADYTYEKSRVIHTKRAVCIWKEPCYTYEKSRVIHMKRAVLYIWKEPYTFEKSRKFICALTSLAADFWSFQLRWHWVRDQLLCVCVYVCMCVRVCVRVHVCVCVCERARAIRCWRERGSVWQSVAVCCSML